MSTLEEVKNMVSQYASVPYDSITETLRLGEDLGIVGDDAEELLESISKSFNVDMSQMTFADYFPAEASADMQHYLAQRSYDSSKNFILKFFHNMDRQFWSIFASTKKYKSITVNDLVNAVELGKWVEKPGAYHH